MKDLGSKHLLIRDIACSYDGSTMAVATQHYTPPEDEDLYVGGHYIYVSDDSGHSWVKQTSAGSAHWSSIVVSDNGEQIAAFAEKLVTTR